MHFSIYNAVVYIPRNSFLFDARNQISKTIHKHMHSHPGPWERSEPVATALVTMLQLGQARQMIKNTTDCPSWTLKFEVKYFVY